MSQKILEKYVYCTQCKKQVLVHIDLNHIRTDIQTGVTKRTIPHQNHLLLLEIDSNGDIRSETTVNLETSNQDIVDIGDIISRIIILSNLKSSTNLVIYGDTKKYASIMSQLIDAGLATDLCFTFISNEHKTLFTYGSMTILITDQMDEVYLMDTINSIIYYTHTPEPKIISHLLNLLPNSYVHLVSSEEVADKFTEFFQNTLGVHKIENWIFNEHNRLKIFELALAQLANPEVL